MYVKLLTIANIELTRQKMSIKMKQIPFYKKQMRCRNHFVQYVLHFLFCHVIFVLAIGSVVQWIEFQIPVLTVGVRFPSGSLQVNKEACSLEEQASLYLYNDLFYLA